MPAASKRSLRILVVTPAPPQSYLGNAVTALRWKRLLAELGHQALVAPTYDGQPCDVLVALHARRSADSIGSFAGQRPRAPIVVGLAGTDLYPDLASTGVDLGVLSLASRIVVLQRLGLGQLPGPLQERGRVIIQSAEPVLGDSPPEGAFAVVVLSHLRPVKDPLLAARAARLLPPESVVEVTHLGASLDAELAEEARAETASNPRYRWLGELSQAEALRRMASSHVLAVTSRHEGGANVVSEALASSVPVVSSRIDGSVGLLGADYPGYFEPGDAAGLAELLWRLERNSDGLLDDLRARARALRPLVDPALERQAWEELLAEISR
jgi:putative glycosyltransferase (TIGR04348 family)